MYCSTSQNPFLFAAVYLMTFFASSHHRYKTSFCLKFLETCFVQKSHWRLVIHQFDSIVDKLVHLQICKRQSADELHEKSWALQYLFASTYLWVSSFVSMFINVQIYWRRESKTKNSVKAEAISSILWLVYLVGSPLSHTITTHLWIRGIDVQWQIFSLILRSKTERRLFVCS